MISPVTPTLRRDGLMCGVAGGVLLELTATGSFSLAALAFAVLVGLLAWGWPSLLSLPSPRGTSGVLGGTALALIVTMAASNAHERTRWAGAIICVGLIGSFLHQLLRQDGRPRLVYSIAGTALGLGLIGSGSYLLASTDSREAQRLMLSAALAVIACLVSVHALRERFRMPIVGLAQIGIGGVLGLIAGLAVDGGADRGLLTGALSGVLCWACLKTVLSYATAARREAQWAAGAASALICAFAPYAIAHL